MGITAGIGVDIKGNSSSVRIYQIPSEEISDDIEQVIQSLETLQDK
jgi:hypothetical protein